MWTWLSQPWFCAMLALALNTAAYSTLLFKGAFNAIPAGQWEACRALGMDKVATLKVLLPYALRRAVPAYSNEVILVFKGTSLASTITIMDLMGYAQRINGQTYGHTNCVRHRRRILPRRKWTTNSDIPSSREEGTRIRSCLTR